VSLGLVPIKGLRHTGLLTAASCINDRSMNLGIEKKEKKEIAVDPLNLSVQELSAQSQSSCAGKKRSRSLCGLRMLLF